MAVAVSSITAPTTAPTLVFERPSTSGMFVHRVSVNPLTFKVIGCSCWAGTAGIVCWAALDVAREEASWSAWEGLLRANMEDRYSPVAVAIFTRASERRHAAEAELAARGESPRGHQAYRRAGLTDVGRVWLEVYEAARSAGISDEVAQRQGLRHARQAAGLSAS